MVSSLGVSVSVCRSGIGAGVLPAVCWSGQSGTGCRSEASSFEIAQLRVMDLSRAAGLAASNPAP